MKVSEVKNMKKDVIKKVAAIAGIVLVAGTVGAVAFSNTEEVPVPYNVTQYVDLTEDQAEAAFNNGVASVILPDVDKAVDEAKVAAFKAGVDAVMDDVDEFLVRLEDKGIIDDAEDAMAEVAAEDNALKLAFDYVDENLDDVFDELEDKGIVEDEDEVEVVRVYNDFEDVEIIKSDFDDEEYKFELRYKIEDLEEEDKKYILVKVGVEDGEAEILKVSEE